MTFLPCPVCGSEHIYDAGLWRHIIKCHTCGFRTRPCTDWSEAVDLWNTRSLTPAQNHADELLECLHYILTQLRLAFMGFGSINIDANKLQNLADLIEEEAAQSDMLS